MNFPQLVTILLGGALGLMIGGLLGAFFLIMSARWSQKIRVKFENAFITVVLSMLASIAMGAFIIALLNAARASIVVVDSTTILMIPGSLLIHGAIIGARLKVSLGRGTIIALTMSGIWLGIAVIVALIVTLVTGRTI